MNLDAVTPSQGQDTESFRTQQGYDSVNTISGSHTPLTNLTGGKPPARRKQQTVLSTTEFLSPPTDHNRSAKGEGKENDMHFFEPPGY